MRNLQVPPGTANSIQGTYPNCILLLSNAQSLLHIHGKLQWLIEKQVRWYCFPRHATQTRKKKSWLVTHGWNPERKGLVHAAPPLTPSFLSGFFCTADPRVSMSRDDEYDYLFKGKLSSNKDAGGSCFQCSWEKRREMLCTFGAISRVRATPEFWTGTNSQDDPLF